MDIDVDRVMALGVEVMQATAALDVHANSSVRALTDVETLWAEAMRHWMAANDIPLSRAATAQQQCDKAVVR